jgi:hypothetical protein
MPSQLLLLSTLDFNKLQYRINTPTTTSTTTTTTTTTTPTTTITPLWQCNSQYGQDMRFVSLIPGSKHVSLTTYFGCLMDLQVQYAG